jgi:hypothetical protein
MTNLIAPVGAPTPSSSPAAPRNGNALVQREYVQRWKDDPGTSNRWTNQVYTAGDVVSVHEGLDAAMTAALELTGTDNEYALGVLKQHDAKWGVWQLGQTMTNVVVRGGLPESADVLESRWLSGSHVSNYLGRYWPDKGDGRTSEITPLQHPDLAAIVTSYEMYRPQPVGDGSTAITFDTFHVASHKPGTSWFGPENPHGNTGDKT